MIFYFTFYLLCRIEGQSLSHLFSEEGSSFPHYSMMLLKTLIVIQSSDPFMLVLHYYLVDCPFIDSALGRFAMWCYY